MPKTRICRDCNQEFTMDQFSSYKGKKGEIKYRYYCKKCDYLRVKEYRRKNKEKVRAQHERYNERKNPKKLSKN